MVIEIRKVVASREQVTGKRLQGTSGDSRYVLLAGVLSYVDLLCIC